MRRYILLVAVALLLAVLACATEPPLATPTVPPEATATPTANQPTQTATAPSTPTSAPETPIFETPTPRVTPGPELPNLLSNANFNGEFTRRDPLNASIIVAEGWQPFYCSPPYTAAPCPAERIGDGNPEGLEMGIPEYKPTDLENRVNSGFGQQWFCFFRACRAGVYQVVETPPNAVCEFGVWVQTWSAGDWIGDAGPYTSFYESDDERANSSWRLGDDPTGGTNAFAGTVQWGAPSGYDAGHFDHFALVTHTFITTGTQTTVFIENLRLWPFAHNDSYVDDAYLRCSSGGAQDVIAPHGLVSQEEFVSMDSGLILQIVFWLLAFVPLLGGAVGGLLAVLVDFLKAVLHLAGWEAADEFWGRVVLILNLLAAGILYFVLGGDPYTLPLPDNLAEIIVTATSLIALVTQLIGQLGIAKLVHWFLKLFAPTLVSTSNRKVAQLAAGAARP